MRWSLDPQGALAHTDRDWKRFTGLTDKETLGQSTRLPSAHPEDRQLVGTIIKSAVETRSCFSMTFRLLKANGDYAWVTAGAAPSFSPIDGRFVGFLGTTDVLGVTPTPLKAIDVMRQVPNTTHEIVMLDMISDHVTTARNVARHLTDPSVQHILDQALLSIGDLLFRKLR